jgi:TetR/AcrR family transcriptional regulator
MTPPTAPAATQGTAASIFLAAAEEFAAHGFDAAGVDRIAARASVNKAMIYYHFQNKRALYVEVLRDMFRAVGARARAIADGPGTAPEKLDTWIDAVIDEAARRPWFPPMMLRELAAGAPRFDPDTFAMMNAVFAAVKDVIEQGQREGVFAAVDPLMTHLTIMPPILIFFARARVLAGHHESAGIAAPRQLDDFRSHMRRAARQLLATS